LIEIEQQRVAEHEALEGLGHEILGIVDDAATHGVLLPAGAGSGPDDHGASSVAAAPAGRDGQAGAEATGRYPGRRITRMPRGEEERARRFYRDAVGLTEVDKPEGLAGRGGCWFRGFDGEEVVAEIHVGVEDPFHPARKAHPALVVDSPEELEAMAARIEA